MSETDYLRLQSERAEQRIRAVLGDVQNPGQTGLAQLVRRHPIVCVAAVVAGGFLAARVMRRLGPGTLRRGAGFAARVAGPVLRATLASSLGLRI